MKATLLALCVAFLAWAQQKPNFSGNWKYDPLRSRSEQVTQPKDLNLRIQHNEPKIRIEVVRDTGGGQATEVFELQTNGTPVEIENAKATARWDDWKGDRLVLVIERKTPKGPVTMTREITAGEKGKILTTILTAKDSAGEKKAYEFYIRE